MTIKLTPEQEEFIKSNLLVDDNGIILPQYYDAEAAAFKPTISPEQEKFLETNMIVDARGRIIPQYYDEVTKAFIPYYGTNVGSSGGGGAVDSVNGKTGEVVITALDVGAVDLATGIAISASVSENSRLIVETETALRDYVDSSFEAGKTYSNDAALWGNTQLLNHEKVTASNTVSGHVKIDGTTIVSNNGVISASPSTKDIGSAVLLTQATTLKEAINEVLVKAEEAFQSGNDAKRDTVAALLLKDNSLPITAESSWTDIVAAIALLP